MTLAPKLTFFAVAITLAVSTQVAGAGGLQVSPTRAFLTAKAKTSAIEISNDGTTTSRLQATAYRWTQSASGEVVLKPTSDIVVYPSLFSIEPGSERNIRIGTKKVAGGAEMTYRVVIEELPPLKSPIRDNESRVRVLTRMSIPVFLQPAKPVARAEVKDFHISGGKATFTVANVGTSYARIKEANVVGLDATGARKFVRSVAGWYLLAGGSWRVRLDLSAAECAAISSVSVEVVSEQGTWRSTPGAPKLTCGS